MPGRLSRWCRPDQPALGPAPAPAPSPEYLIRTGSVRSRVLGAEPGGARGAGRGAGQGNYATCNIQAGCYTWQGRAYYRDSYMVHRRETTDRREKGGGGAGREGSEAGGCNYQTGGISQECDKAAIKAGAVSEGQSGTGRIAENPVRCEDIYPATSRDRCSSLEQGRCRALNDDIRLGPARIAQVTRQSCTKLNRFLNSNISKFMNVNQSDQVSAKNADAERYSHPNLLHASSSKSKINERNIVDKSVDKAIKENIYENIPPSIPSLGVILKYRQPLKL